LKLYFAASFPTKHAIALTSVVLSSTSMNDFRQRMELFPRNKIFSKKTFFKRLERIRTFTLNASSNENFKQKFTKHVDVESFEASVKKIENIIKI
jgi:hypothetical protein